MSVRVCGSRRDGQYVERMVYSMLLRQKPSFKDGLARPKRGKPISTTRCDFLKRDKDFVSRVSVFLFKSQKPVLSLVSPCMLRTLCHSFFKGNVHK